MKSVKDEALDTELIKTIPIDDVGLKKENMFTTRISEEQVKQQTEALKTFEDAAVDLELFKPMTINDTELNKLHQESSISCCDVSGFYFMEDTIIDIPFCCRHHTDAQQQAVGVLQQQRTSSMTCTTGERNNAVPK